MGEKPTKKVLVLPLHSLSLPSAGDDKTSVHYLPGDVVELEPAEAEALIEQGFVAPE